jgi:hypothetical protein
MCALSDHMHIARILPPLSSVPFPSGYRYRVQHTRVQASPVPDGLVVKLVALCAAGHRQLEGGGQ